MRPHAYKCVTRSAMLVAGLASIAGCAVGPNYHAPALPADAGYSPVPLPARTRSADVPGGPAQELISGADIPFAWWEQFHSPAINALVEQAFRNNPGIVSAQAALREAQQLVDAQRGFFFPAVSAGYQFQRQRVAGNLAASTAPGAQGNGQVLEPGAPAQPLIYDFHTASLTVGYTPDVFGGNRRQVETLIAQADDARFTLEATYITLAADVVAAAIQEASLRAQIEATDQIIEANQHALRILRDQLRLGFAMRLDVAAQESAVDQAQATLPPLQKQLEQTRDLIRALAGRLPNQDVTQSFRMDALSLPIRVPLSLPAKLIGQRPDVQAAAAELHAANAQVGVAVANMLPQFSIGAEAGGVANEFAWMFRSGGPFWSLVGGVSAPVFQGGTLYHRKRAANEALIEAGAQYQSTVIAAYQNVADSLHALLTDADALRAQVQAEQAARTTLDLTQRQMQVGYVNYLTLLNAQAAYQQALLARIQVQALRYGDTVALFQALGGGWWNRPAGPSAQ